MLRRHAPLRPRVTALAAIAVLALTAAACGDAGVDAGSTAAPDETTETDAPDADDAVDAVDDPDASGSSDDMPAAGACLEGTTDCVDTPELGNDEPVQIDETGIQQFAADAQYYLGRDESELPDTIRIGRRGEESLPVTDDYVIGRMTAELDDPDGDGVHTVTSIIVELPDGPETFEAPA